MLERNYDIAYSKAPGVKGIYAQTQVDYSFMEDVSFGLILLTAVPGASGPSSSQKQASKATVEGELQLYWCHR
jgi:hypothetical protein